MTAPLDRVEPTDGPAVPAVPDQVLAGVVAGPADRPPLDPVWAYLARLDSQESRRTMRGCLDRIARLLTGSALDDPSVTAVDVPWWRLRSQHPQPLRAALVEQGWSVSHTNKHIVALRQVVIECW